jgi:hypothetical protein
MYVVDERDIADAILARAAVNALVPEASFANRRLEAKSFRHDPAARSFRLSRPSSMRRAYH